MTIDMSYFNVYYFCHLANESMGKFEYATNNALFTEQQFEVEPEDFPKTSVLREYCYWLVESIFFEQANLINLNTSYDFNPINWLNQEKLDISDYDMPVSQCEDYLERLNSHIEFLEKMVEGVYYETISFIAMEVEYILFQNRDFLLRFNEQQAVAFEKDKRTRTYIPEWVKRAILFRDKGCCVFCKKDLTGLYTLLDDNEKHFDHIVPLNLGGINDVCNIQLSCKKCNLKKSDTIKTSKLYQSAY